MTTRFQRQGRKRKAKRRPAARLADLAHLPPEQQAALVQRDYARHMLESERTADGLIALAAQAVRLAEKTAAGYRKSRPPERPIACAIGCSHCCLVNVRATPPEVIRIAAHVRQHFSAAEIAALKRRLDEAIARSGDSDSARLGASIYCPLLVEHRCTVYEVRPMKCRGVESFDAEACRRGFLLGERARPQFDLDHYRIYDELQTALIRGLADAGYRRPTLDLNRALRIALDEPEAGRRWLKGERLFAPARRARPSDPVAEAAATMGAGTRPGARPPPVPPPAERSRR